MRQIEGKVIASVIRCGGNATKTKLKKSKIPMDARLDFDFEQHADLQRSQAILFGFGATALFAFALIFREETTILSFALFGAIVLLFVCAQKGGKARES